MGKQVHHASLAGRVTPDAGSRSSQRGFTLFELLTALVLLGIASSIFFQLFEAAMTLSEQSTKGRTAARLATERIALVAEKPEAFQWPRYETRPVGELIPLVKTGKETHVSTPDLPSALPTTQRGHNRTTTHYGDFTVESYTCLPEADASHVRIVAVVKWSAKKNRRAFSLTTTVPRSAVGG